MSIDILSKFHAMLEIGASSVEETKAFSSIRHEEMCEVVKDWLEKHKEFWETPVDVKILQGMRDKGVDVMIDFPKLNLKVGFQIKTPNDVREDSFSKNTLAQISESKAHKIQKLFLLLCGDMTTQKVKIRSFMSRLSQMNDPFIGLITPQESFRIYKNRDQEVDYNELWRRYRKYRIPFEFEGEVSLYQRRRKLNIALYRLLEFLNDPGEVTASNGELAKTEFELLPPIIVGAFRMVNDLFSSKYEVELLEDINLFESLEKFHADYNTFQKLSRKFDRYVAKLVTEYFKIHRPGVILHYECLCAEYSKRILFGQSRDDVVQILRRYNIAHDESEPQRVFEYIQADRSLTTHIKQLVTYLELLLKDIDDLKKRLNALSSKFAKVFRPPHLLDSPERAVS